MNDPIQFDIWALLVCTTITAVLLASRQIAGHHGMCLASLLLAVILFAMSIVRSSCPGLVAAGALMLFYLFAGLITVAPQ